MFHHAADIQNKRLNFGIPSMLLKRLVAILEAHDANIMSTLTVQDMVKFLCVAADVVVRSENSLQLTTNRRPIQFLAASLPSSIHPFLEVFWDASFHILKDCYINTEHQINSNGIMAELGDGRIPARIVHRSLFPPFKHCPKCAQERPMRSSSLFGYLYNVDGCRTIKHFSLYCQREPFNFNLRWTRTDGFVRLYLLCFSMPDQVSCKLLDPQRTKDILYEFSRQEPHTIPSSYALLHDSPLGASLQDEPNATTVRLYVSNLNVQ
ncbi:hypothetical protein H4Q26_014952 [Puccinia striiformis f. sp. tritici PST-130]|nr:hypothetical protein H4Q26_014952 [Puccinia striiformis f. sp. tritici PST-130]